jgi:hypothetical protein
MTLFRTCQGRRSGSAGYVISRAAAAGYRCQISTQAAIGPTWTLGHVATDDSGCIRRGCLGSGSARSRRCRGTSANRSGGSAVVPANWQTFHDKLGFYSLRFPRGWTAQGGSGPGPTEGDSSGSITLTAEGFHFTDPSEGTGSAEVYIFTTPIPLNTAWDRQYFCYTSPQYRTAFHGLPAIGTRSVYLFDTGNASFQIDVTIPGVLVPISFGPPPPAATPIPTSWITTDQADVHGILNSFQPTDPKPLAY